MQIMGVDLPTRQQTVAKLGKRPLRKRTLGFVAEHDRIKQGQLVAAVKRLLHDAEDLVCELVFLSHGAYDLSKKT